MNLETRIRALETAAGNGWAEPIFVESRPTPEQISELAENAKRGIRQLIFFRDTDSCWINTAGAPPWAA
nr:D474 [uncultured bacterium]